MISTSPSVGHEKGSCGRSQKAGQIPGATGAVMRAVRIPLFRESGAWEERRAEVYALDLSGCELSMMARMMSASVALPSVLDAWNEFFCDAT
jgi:hypothetical protein